MNDETLEIRLLETAEQMAPIVTMFQQVWGSVIPLVGVELLRAIGHGGGYVAGAFDSGHIVGASFGFLARFDGEHALHSHVTGILPGVQRSGVGRAMKNHQRSWAAEQGLKWVTWTFDPLVRRNAWFNIEVLRAHVAEYLVDFYGPMTDSVNAHDESDRLLVAWPTDPTATIDEPDHDPHAIEVPTPEDIVVIRRTEPDSGARVAPAGPRGARRTDAPRRGGHRLHPRRRLHRVRSLDREGWCSVKIGEVELRRIGLPLVVPFRTSFGTETDRDILLIRVSGDDGATGLGRVRGPGGTDLLGRVRRRRGARDRVPPAAATRGGGRRHRRRRGRAAAASQGAPDGEGGARDGDPRRRAARAMARACTPHFGSTRDRIPSGVSVGIFDTIDRLLSEVQGYVDDGYVRIKLKIEPGWDIEPVRLVRELIGPDMPLQVDANTAYSRVDIEHLCRLDEFDLLLIEQPLDEEDIVGHAELAKASATPVCLDESIVSARTAADAIALGAAEIINIKPGRVGGYLEARRIHDLCVDRGIPVWCGGMVETGHRARRQRRSRRPARVHAAGRHQRLDALLCPRHRHRADHRGRRARHGADRSRTRLRARRRLPRLGHHRHSHDLNPPFCLLQATRGCV